MMNGLKHKDLHELKPRIVVIGVGGAGGNALNNMIAGGLEGVEFVAANTDAQALLTSKAKTVIQIGMQLTEGLGAGSRAEIGAAAAEEAADEIREQLEGAHMVFVTAGMGGGTGSGAAPVISRIARELGILTVGVVTKPFQFEGLTRMRTAEKAVTRLRENVDTLIVIPNQNLFRVTNENTTFSDAFAMADKVLHSGIASITDLMVKEGLINLDFADVKIVMSNMGKSMMGTGIASGENRGQEAARLAITNPLLDDVSLEGAKGVLVSIIGGRDLTLFEVEQAAETIRKVVDKDANIIVGATFDEGRKNDVLVAVLATGLGGHTGQAIQSTPQLAPTQKVNSVVAPMPKVESTVVTPTIAPTITEDVFVAAPLIARKEMPVSVQIDPDMRVGFVEKEQDLQVAAVNESAKITPKNDKKSWVSDEGVTIQPIKHKKSDAAVKINVAEKAHKKDELKVREAESFVPAPVQNVTSSSQNMPVLGDFSPLAQQAVKATKEPAVKKEKGVASLFERLSGLGKKRLKPKAEKEIEMTKVEPVLTAAMPEEEPCQAPIAREVMPEVREPISMNLTDEEEMEIPSFFKRKA